MSKFRGHGSNSHLVLPVTAFMIRRGSDEPTTQEQTAPAAQEVRQVERYTPPPPPSQSRYYVGKGASVANPPESE